jgi:hypothetical protein
MDQNWISDFRLLMKIRRIKTKIRSLVIHVLMVKNKIQSIKLHLIYLFHSGYQVFMILKMESVILGKNSVRLWQNSLAKSHWKI